MSGFSARMLLLSLLFAGQLATAFAYRADLSGYKTNVKLGWTFPRGHRPVLDRSRFNSAQPSFPDGSSEALSPAVDFYGRLLGASRMKSWVRGYKPVPVSSSEPREPSDWWRFVFPQAQKGNRYPLGVVSSHAIRMTSGHQSEAEPQQPRPSSQRRGYAVTPPARPQRPSVPALHAAWLRYPFHPPASSGGTDDEQTLASLRRNRFHTGVASSPRIVMHSGVQPKPEAQAQQNYPVQTQSQAGKWKEEAFVSVVQFPEFLPRLYIPEAAGFSSG